MSLISKIDQHLRPNLYLRESQIARLFISAFQDFKNTEEIKNYKKMLTKLANNDHGFFERLAHSDPELLIWLINEAWEIFEEKFPHTGISLLEFYINEPLADWIYNLSVLNKAKLGEIYRENENFFSYFKSMKKANQDLVIELENYLKKENLL